MELPNKPGHMFTALDIATRSGELDCWSVGADNATVLTTAREEHYSFLPVRQDGDIVGIGRTDELAAGSEWMPLTSDWLIASNTPIIDLVSLFAERPEQVFFVLHGKEVGGLVAPADLNKTPARASIYVLLSEFERRLGDLILTVLPSEEKYCRDLHSSVVKDARSRRRKSRVNDLDLELLRYMYLRDLLVIVRHHQALREDLGFFAERNDKQISAWLDDINDVRNLVGHPVRPLISSRDELNRLHSVCETFIEWTAQVQQVYRHLKRTAPTTHHDRRD